MKQFFRDLLAEVSWLAILSIICVILLNVLMLIGVATWSLAVSLGLTAVVAAILSLRE